MVKANGFYQRTKSLKCNTYSNFEPFYNAKANHTKVPERKNITKDEIKERRQGIKRSVVPPREN